MTPTIVFFGSFGKYSAKVLTNLLDSKLVKVTAVVTTPPFENKKKQLIKNEVQIVAETEKLPVFTPHRLIQKEWSKFISPENLPDFIITAGYGKLLPQELLDLPKINALNLHFSLLPQYRGANPGEWAILMNENITGISIIEMNGQFDAGKIIASAQTTLDTQETRESLYEKLYSLGGRLLPQIIADYAKNPKINTLAQPQTDLPKATRFKRVDSFIEWQAFEKAMNGKIFPPQLISKKLQKIARLLKINQLDAKFLEKSVRALLGFPGVWTLLPTSKGQKRMKILSTTLENERLILNIVQIEGKEKTSWNSLQGRTLH